MDFDKEQIYDDEIFPLMAQIIAVCRRESIPMVASFMYAADEDGEDYCTTVIGVDSPHFAAKFARAATILQREPTFPVMRTTIGKGARP